jgi:lipopolysaccharide biosynthesis glycosyltransferase
MLKVVVGFDPREALVYHVFCQSVINHASGPVSFVPLAINTLSDYCESHGDGSNEFIYSRFLTPYLCNYDGWAIYADGDMVCRDDIYKLFAMKDPTKAVQVVKHDYLTVATQKYFGNKNENYPRKNWSSVMLWNCGHEAVKCLTPDLVETKTGAFLHRFQWLDDALVGDLPKEWNWLATEYEDNYEAKLVHYTLGAPCLKDYAEAPMADIWFKAFEQLKAGLDG